MEESKSLWSVSGVVSAFVVYYYLNYLSRRYEFGYTWTPGIFGWAMLAGFACFI